jgi:hypothetical protein
MTRTTTAVRAALALAFMMASLGVSGPAAAQPRGGPPQPPPAPRDAAPFDITGTWVSIVNEDWRWRMVTPPKGDTTSVQPLNAQGRAAVEAWDPSQDGSCKAYGAPALLRMPTRLRISWDGADVLKLETDAGKQTRLLRFAPSASAPTAAPSLQGDSHAEWQRSLRRVSGLGPPPPGPPPPGGSLEVITTNLAPGWLRRNGVPYSERTTLTEYFDEFAAPNGAQWLVVTTIVEDPTYLTGRFVTSSHFRREPNASKWSPKPCRSDP